MGGYISLEYKPFDKVVFNLSGILESDEYDGNRKYYVNPRMSTNFHINRNSTLRFIYSKAIRTPNLLETSRNWNYIAKKITPDFDGNLSSPFFYTAKTNNILKPEKIESREISYYYTNSEKQTSLDIKIFSEKRYDLISEKLQYVDYKPTNEGKADLTGIEFESRMQHHKNIRTIWSYAFIKNHANNVNETTLEANHNLNASIVFSNDRKETIALSAYYEKYKLNGIYRAYEITGQMKERIRGKELGLTIQLRYLNALPSYFRTLTENVSSEYSQNIQLLLGFRYSMD